MSCANAIEVCGDGIDNNCNGDKDEGFDQDEDGYTWCGDTTDSMGGMASADCDDNDPMVHPNAAEPCDGADNDCDQLTDEMASSTCKAKEMCIDYRCVVPTCAIKNSGETCGPGEVCDFELQRCVLATDCTVMACKPDESCDALLKTCKKLQKSRNGESCVLDGDCQSGRCIDAAALRFAQGARVCGKACCDDDQCATGERCFASGTGARSCLPAERVPSGYPAFCAADVDCPAPSICAVDAAYKLEGAPFPFTPRTAVVTNFCRLPDERLKSLGGSCTDVDDCNSNVCVSRKVLGQTCSTTCAKTADCLVFGDHAGLASKPQDVYCRYVQAGTLNPPDYGAICVVDLSGNERGQGPFNAECTSAADCVDRGCVGATSTKKGRCTPTCCSDADCPGLGGDRPGSCRPFAFGTGYEMRCELPAL